MTGRLTANTFCSRAGVPLRLAMCGPCRSSVPITRISGCSDRSRRGEWQVRSRPQVGAYVSDETGNSGGSPLVTGSSVERENQRPSHSWVSPTSVGSAASTELSSSGGLRQRSEWSRSSKPSRLTFNAGSIIVRLRSCTASKGCPGPLLIPCRDVVQILPLTDELLEAFEPEFSTVED